MGEKSITLKNLSNLKTLQVQNKKISKIINTIFLRLFKIFFATYAKNWTAVIWCKKNLQSTNEKSRNLAQKLYVCKKKRNLNAIECVC